MRKFPTIVLIPVLAIVLMVIFYFLGHNHNYKPAPVKELMSGQEIRHNVVIEGVLREQTISFPDGCVAVKKLDATASNGSSILTEAREFWPDGRLTVYTFAADGKTVATTEVYRKDKTLHSRVVAATSTTTFYFEDGVAILATYEANSAGNRFVLYHRTGGIIYEQFTIPAEEGMMEQTRFTVFNLNVLPLYSQVWTVDHSSDEGEGDGDPLLELLTEFHPGTSIVDRKLAFGKTIQVKGENDKDKDLKVTEVTVFDGSAKVRMVRYLDEENRILRMIDKSTTPETVLDIQPTVDSAREWIDSSHLEAPATPLGNSLIAQAVSGPQTHLSQLLIP